MAAPYGGGRLEYTQNVPGRINDVSNAVSGRLEKSGFRILASSQRTGSIWGQRTDIGRDKGDIFIYFSDVAGATQVKCAATDHFFLSKSDFERFCEGLVRGAK
jgi:hypothetical protein